MNHFLDNKEHAFTIAKIAIVFQSCATIIISTTLLLSLQGGTGFSKILSLTLLLDVVFVVTHLTYRALYSGPKVALMLNEKILLILHAGSSLFALILTYMLLPLTEEVSKLSTVLLLCLWGVSLISGVHFFIKKYLS